MALRRPIVDAVRAPRRNIELKATDPDPPAPLEVCRALRAEDRGTITQRDTYLEVTRGRLKLREEQPGRPHLIQFERASEPQQRKSRYRIVEVSDGAALCAALAAAIGIRGVVAKRRHLLLWQSVRIHLDEVEQLGTFIELEAVAPPDSNLAHEHRLMPSCATRSASPTNASSPSATPRNFSERTAIPPQADMGEEPRRSAQPAATIPRMTAKEKLRAQVEDLTEQEAEATLEFIAARGQSFGDWLDSRPEDDEPLSPEEQAALADSDADIAAGRIVSYAEVKQALDAG